MEKLTKNERNFTSFELRNYHNGLLFLGDRFLYDLMKEGIIKIQADKSYTNFYIKSDIFEIETAKRIVKDGGHYVESSPQENLI